MCKFDKTLSTVDAHASLLKTPTSLVNPVAKTGNIASTLLLACTATASYMVAVWYKRCVIRSEPLAQIQLVRQHVTNQHPVNPAGSKVMGMVMPSKVVEADSPKCLPQGQLRAAIYWKLASERE